MAPYLILNLGDTNRVRYILLVLFINKETDGQSGSAIFLQLGSLETKTQFSENKSSAFFPICYTVLLSTISITF